jgi:formylglycine-generating enzyme required for sulfatase activity
MIEPFTCIPAGSFLMGSDEGRDDERPVHRVWVDRFDMAVYPVTRATYAAFLDATGHEAPRDWHLETYQDPDLPVVGVSWHDAVAYCAWSSARGVAVRLPTEAEWERAARGGREQERYPWGNELPEWLPAGGRGSLAGPWAVSLGPPNGFGVRGIGANIHEWCADWHAADYYGCSPASNPTGPPQGTRKASRGGSWRHAITISRSAARSRLDPSFRYSDYGFRLVRDSRLP